VCRTFSDCTTGPRHGLISGCYPLDEYYKERPERRELVAIKRTIVGRKVRVMRVIESGMCSITMRQLGPTT
jgi:NADPH2 dehydrogenase